jgi:hypothetical protein
MCWYCGHRSGDPGKTSTRCRSVGRPGGSNVVQACKPCNHLKGKLTPRRVPRRALELRLGGGLLQDARVPLRHEVRPAPGNEDRFRQPAASASRSRRSAAPRADLATAKQLLRYSGTGAVKAILPRQHPASRRRTAPRWRSQMSARSNRSATSGVELDDGLCPSQRANVADRPGAPRPRRRPERPASSAGRTHHGRRTGRPARIRLARKANIALHGARPAAPESQC